MSYFITYIYWGNIQHTVNFTQGQWGQKTDFRIISDSAIYYQGLQAVSIEATVQLKPAWSFIYFRKAFHRKKNIVIQIIESGLSVLLQVNKKKKCMK